MCDLHEAAENLRAERRREIAENICIAAMLVIAVAIFALSFADYLQ